MANTVRGARGEGVIMAGGREVHILYTNRALAEAEGQMGKSVLGVAQGFAGGDSSLGDLAHLLRAGMQAARRESGERRPVKLTEAYEVMDAVGFSEVASAVMQGVAAVLGYSADDEADDDTDPN